MRYILSAKEMQTIDERTQEKFCVPSLVLMERAALAVCEEAEALINCSEKLRYLSKKQIRILSVCGSGNNGGDGLACARILHTKGYSAEVLFVGNPDHMTDSCKAQMTSVNAYGIPVTEDTAALERADIIIDAIFGIGLNRQLSERYIKLIDTVNKADAFRISVDIPSGIDADTGKLFGSAVKCSSTVTFNFAKRGHVFFPGAEYTGKLVVRDVGITELSAPDDFHPLMSFESEDLSLLSKRRPNGHKGTFGKVLVIAGSEEICGAAILASSAALHSGCGMVKVFTHENNRTAVCGSLPEAMITSYGDLDLPKTLSRLEKDISWCDVILIGPGIGVSERSLEFVKAAAASDKPLVLDADALNVIGKYRLSVSNRNNDTIITPHLLEMARLTGLTAAWISENIVECCRNYRKEQHVICVLKDARTVTCTDRTHTYVNLSGNDGMATAGSGDVLAGIIAGLLAQKTPGNIAAPLGVYLHGHLGDIAKDNFTARALIASSIIDSFACLEGE